MLYYALKPNIEYLFHLRFVNFDIITLIQNFSLNFHYLDLNYTTLLIFLSMLGISLTVIKISHIKTNEKKVMKYGIFSFAGYLILYFFILGTVWVGIAFDLLRGKKQKW